MAGAVEIADAVLKDANMPTYSEAVSALRALAKEIGMAKHVDTHITYKAWVLLDMLDRAQEERHADDE